MTPQQRVRNVLAAGGHEHTTGEVGKIFRHIHEKLDLKYPDLNDDEIADAIADAVMQRKEGLALMRAMIFRYLEQ